MEADARVPTPPAMEADSESTLERAASGVCDRMRTFLTTWITQFATMLETMKSEETVRETELGTNDTTVARMIAIEALARIYDCSVPDCLRLDGQLLSRLYAETLPEVFYRGHVDRDSDWKILLSTSPLVEGLVRQRTAMDSLASMIDHIAVHRNYLIDLRIVGLRTVNAFLSPGSKDDDIGRELFKVIALDPMCTETRSNFVLNIVQTVMGIIFFTSGLILSKERGTPPESLQESYAREAASKRTINEVLSGDTFTSEIRDLTSRLASEVVLAGGGPAPRPSSKRQGRRRHKEEEA